MVLDELEHWIAMGGPEGVGTSRLERSPPRESPLFATLSVSDLLKT